MRPAAKPRWQQATALVSLSAGGVVTGLSFVPGSPADLISPAGLPMTLLALEKSAQATPSDDARLRSAIVNVARHFLRMAERKTPAEMEAVIWQHASVDGADHGPSCAAFASLTLELGSHVTGHRSWVTGGTTYPWPLHAWADARVDPNPASPGIVSVLQDAQQHDRWHPLGDGYNPQPGDWVLFDGHVEVVTAYAGGVLYTIGGDSVPNYSVNAHSYPAPLGGQGVAGFVDNGLHPATPSASPGQGQASAQAGGQAPGPQRAKARPASASAPVAHAKPGAQPRPSGAKLTSQQVLAPRAIPIPGTAAKSRALATQGGQPGVAPAGPPAQQTGQVAEQPRAVQRHPRGQQAASPDIPAGQASSRATPGTADVPGTRVRPAAPGRAAERGQAQIPGLPHHSVGAPRALAPYQRHQHPAEARPQVPGTAAQRAFINQVAAGAMATQRRYGIPASVTIAQAIDESGWGQSLLATRDHNLFGIKGTGPAGSDLQPTVEFVGGRLVGATASFRMYHDIGQSIEAHGRLLANSAYYTHAMAQKHSPNDFAAALTGVYATDPTYGAKLVELMQRYELYRFDAAARADARGARAGFPAARAGSAATPGRAAIPGVGQAHPAHNQPIGPAPAQRSQPAPPGYPPPSPRSAHPGRSARPGHLPHPAPVPVAPQPTGPGPTASPAPRPNPVRTAGSGGTPQPAAAPSAAPGNLGQPGSAPAAAQVPGTSQGTGPRGTAGNAGGTNAAHPARQVGAPGAGYPVVPAHPGAGRRHAGGDHGAPAGSPPAAGSADIPGTAHVTVAASAHPRHRTTPGQRVRPAHAPPTTGRNRPAQPGGAAAPASASSSRAQGRAAHPPIPRPAGPAARSMGQARTGAAARAAAPGTAAIPGVPGAAAEPAAVPPAPTQVTPLSSTTIPGVQPGGGGPAAPAVDGTALGGAAIPGVPHAGAGQTAQTAPGSRAAPGAGAPGPGQRGHARPAPIVRPAPGGAAPVSAQRLAAPPGRAHTSASGSAPARSPAPGAGSRQASRSAPADPASSAAPPVAAGPSGLGSRGAPGSAAPTGAAAVQSGGSSIPGVPAGAHGAAASPAGIPGLPSAAAAGPPAAQSEAPDSANARTTAVVTGSARVTATRYSHRLPPAVGKAFLTSAKVPLVRGEPLYADVAAVSGIGWELLAACDWLQCKARHGLSPVYGEKLGTLNPDGTCYRTRSAALERCAYDLVELALSVYEIDITRAQPLSVRELANVFAAYRWGGLLKEHHTSAMEFPYSVAGLTLHHMHMRWPNIDDPHAPDRPGSKFHKPFGAVPLLLGLNYPATA